MPALAWATNPAHQVAWRRRVASVSPASSRRSSAVLADRLEQPVAGAGGRRCRRRRATCRRAGRRPSSTSNASIVARRRDRLGRVEGEPAREHRQAVEQLAARVGASRSYDQSTACAQRLVTLHRGAAAAGEEPEPLVEPRRDLCRASSSAPAPPRARSPSGIPSSRRQISRDRVDVVRVEHEAVRAPRPRGPRTAAPHPPPPPDRRDGPSSAGSAERRHRQDALPATAEPLAARRQHRSRRDTRCDHRVDERGDRVEEVLAVVEHEQQLAWFLQRRRAIALGRAHALAVAARPTPPRPPPAPRPDRATGPSSHSHTPSRKRGSSLRRDLQREAGLADATHTGERHDAAVVATPRAISTSSRSRPTNDVSCTGRFAGNASSDRSGGNSRCEPGMHDLEDPLRRRPDRAADAHRDRPTRLGDVAAPARSVASDTTICPPCATAINRAARFTAVP